MRLFIFTVIAIILAAPVTYAQSEFELNELAAGEVLLNISATQRVEVEQDLLVTQLEYEYRSHTRTDAQNTVNLAVREAVDYLKGIENIEFSTGSYSIRKIKPRSNEKQVDEQGQPLRWQAQQTIRLESKNFEVATDAIGKLQGMNFMARGLSTKLSSEKFAKTQDNLMEAALEKLQTRANRAAKALQKSSVHFVEVSVQPERAAPVRRQYGLAVESAMSRDAVAPPVAEAGNSNISLSVTAKVILR